MWGMFDETPLHCVDARQEVDAGQEGSGAAWKEIFSRGLGLDSIQLLVIRPKNGYESVPP